MFVFIRPILLLLVAMVLVFMMFMLVLFMLLVFPVFLLLVLLLLSLFANERRLDECLLIKLHAFTFFPPTSASLSPGNDCDVSEKPPANSRLVDSVSVGGGRTTTSYKESNHLVTSVNTF